MNQTEIKVPGKRTRDQSAAAREARKALNLPRGRRPNALKEHANAPADTHEHRSAKKRTMGNLKSKKRMSQLERLPVELLEHIFLYCLNLDLPKSSPIIGGKLSNQHLYIRTVYTAFDARWRLNCVKDHDNRDMEHEEVSDDPKTVELQSSILRCQWAKLPIILGALEYWNKRNVPARADFISFSEALVVDESSDNISDRFDQDFVEFSNSVTDIDRIFASAYWNTNQGISEGVEIPLKLLRGPWSDESVRRLYWVAISGAQINWITSTSGEVAQIGLRSAIIAGDLRVIQLLLWVGLNQRFDVQFLVWAMQNVKESRHAIILALLRTHLLCQTVVQKVQSLQDKNYFLLALYKMLDDASRINDVATIEILREVEELPEVASWDVDIDQYPLVSEQFI